MIKLVPLRKPKSQQFYIALSLMLVLSGIAMVFTADYSKGPAKNNNHTGNVIILTEGNILPWQGTGPEYVTKSGSIYQFCKAGYCWGFDSSDQSLINQGTSYKIPSNIMEVAPLIFEKNHEDFSLNFQGNNVYICSDEFCWRMDEGVNNIIQTDEILNSTGKSSMVFEGMIGI